MVKEAKPEWVKMKPEELKKIVIELAKQGNSPAQIGLILRDKHGVPKAKLLGKRIAEIMSEENIENKSAVNLTESKIGKLNAHIVKHKHDMSAKRSLTKNLWDLHHLEQGI